MDLKLFANIMANSLRPLLGPSREAAWVIKEQVKILPRSHIRSHRLNNCAGLPEFLPL